MSLRQKLGEKIYAAYRGEKWLIDGTTSEIARFLNIPLETVKYRCTPTAHRKFNDGEDGSALLIYFIGREKELV